MYLLDLADPDLTARSSTSSVGRARRLQEFLRPLQRAGAARATLHGRTELWVLDERDWAQVARVPYGWPFTRTRATPASAAHADGPTTAIVVAAEVPGRLVRRFEPPPGVRIRVFMPTGELAADSRMLRGFLAGLAGRRLFAVGEATATAARRADWRLGLRGSLGCSR